MVISEKHFQQFVKGDEKSFESIFCQYYKTLVSYAMRHDPGLMRTGYHGFACGKKLQVKGHSNFTLFIKTSRSYC